MEMFEVYRVETTTGVTLACTGTMEMCNQFMIAHGQKPEPGIAYYMVPAPEDNND